MLALAAALASAMHDQSAPDRDTLKRYRELKEMATEGYLVTGPDLKEVLGIGVDDLDGEERYGYVFHRVPTKGKNKWLWGCRRADSATNGNAANTGDSADNGAIGSSAGIVKRFGHFGAEEELNAARALITVTAVDCTGSALMAQNRIG